MKNMVAVLLVPLAALWSGTLKHVQSNAPWAALAVTQLTKEYRAFVRMIMVLHSRPMGTLAVVALSPVIALVGVVLAVIIVILVLAALAPTFFSAVRNITQNISSADLGSPLANTIAGIVAILVPLALLFGFIFLIFRAIGKMKGGKGY